MGFWTRAFAVLLVALSLGFFLTKLPFFLQPPLPRSLQDQNLTCEAKPQLCDSNLGDAPLIAAPNNLHSSGRWNKAAVFPNLGGNEDTLQFKRWQYMSVVNEDFFIACAFVKFSYISDVFFYAVNRHTKQRVFEYTGRLPFGVGLFQYMESSVGEECTRWGIPKSTVDAVTTNSWMELCAKAGGGYTLRAHLLSGEKESFKVNVVAHSGTDLVFAFPLNGDESRLMYVHKLAGMSVAPTSFVQHNQHPPVSLKQASAALDWTKGRCLYRTAWRWVSFNDPHARIKDKEVVLGINLSNEIYDVVGLHGQPVSIENAVWLDGKLFPLTGAIDIVVGKLPLGEWRIQSRNSTADEHVDLVFTPWGQREDHMNAIVLVSDFVQPYGTFRGVLVVRGISVELSNPFGVVETHLAYW